LRSVKNFLSLLASLKARTVHGFGSNLNLP
jgi:hypothetical protein